VVRDADLIPLPPDVPDEMAAAVGLSGVAAWMALTWRAQLEPGERVLVLGGGGAVGQAAIGAAKHLGACRVVAVCRNEAAEQRREALTAVTTLAAAGRLTVAAETLPLSDVGEAWRRQATGDAGVRFVVIP